MPKMYFAPNGSPITRVSAESFDCPNIEIDDKDGSVDLGHHDDFPEFQRYIIPDYGGTLFCIDGNEWLESHCRLVEVSESFDIWSGVVLPDSLVWDKEIVKACSRVEHLGRTLWAVKKLVDWSADGVINNSTVSAALNHLIVGRVRDEIDTLQAKIANYRAGRVEPTEIKDEDEPCPVNRRPQSTCPDGCTHGA